MRVLLIDCFEDPKSKEFKCFSRLLRGWFADSTMRDAVGHIDVVSRRLNNLYDYAIDWEYDMLDENGKKICKRFDCLSLIIVSGDMKITPWHMGSSQLTTVLWMAEMSKKPTLCCGAGAFAAVYSAAGQGTKFNVLNQPNGESLEKLAHFPRYSRAVGQFPGVWFDNETGDIYKYNTQYKTWTPVGNIGIHRYAMRGRPTPARFRPVPKHYASADHALRKAQVPEAIGDDEFVAHVRSKFVDHFALKNLPTTSFVCSVIPDWYLNDEGSLPCNGMCIAADTEMGPVVIVRELSVYIAAKVGDDLNQSDVREIGRSYINHIVSMVASRDDGNLGDSIFAFLFGNGGSSGGTYDSVKHRKVYSAPLSQTRIRTFIPKGPLRTDPPLVQLFIEAPPEDAAPIREAGNEVGGKAQTKLSFPMTSPVKPTRALEKVLDMDLDMSKLPSPVSPRKTTVVSVRDPHKNRKQRLAKFLKSVGHKGMLNLNKKVAAENARLDPYGIDNARPDSARDIFQGLRMDTNNVFSRRPTRPEEADDTNGEVPEFQSPTGENIETNIPDDISDAGVDIFADSEIQGMKKSNSRMRPKSAHETSSGDLKANPSGRHNMTVTRGSSIVEGAMATQCLPIRRPMTAGKMPNAVEYIQRSSSKPFNNKQKYDAWEERDRNKPVSDYPGMFKGGYLTSFEKERKEHVEAKKNFLNGDFIRIFDRASSIPLRSEGQIRPHGEYPQHAPNSMHLKPTDWHHVRAEEPKKVVAEQWKPVTSKNSFMKNSFNY